MTARSSKYFPCATFFAAGRAGAGIATLLMQLSLVFWPMAARLAREFRENSGKQRLLVELSERHRLPVDYAAQPVKRFRQAA